MCTGLRTPSVMAMIVFNNLALEAEVLDEWIICVVFALDRVVGIAIMAVNEFEE